jgi:exonuclease III
MFLSFCGASSAVGFTIVLEGWLFLGACVFYSSNMNDQHCIILNWNARGLNNPARRQVVRDSVKETKATIVALQETKLKLFDSAIVCETLGNNFRDQFVFLPSVGLSGGILFAVDADYYSILSSERGVHTLTATISSSIGVVTWSATVVYGPQGDAEKLQFLGELRWVKTNVTEKWLVLGYFNLILQAADKSNHNLNRRLMGAFRDLIRDLELKELNLRGRKFTWSNDRTQTRIDRAFCTTAWDLMLPNVHLQALSSSVSDHSPLLVVGAEPARKFRGFRFEAFWPKLQGYAQVVHQPGTETLQSPILALGCTLNCKEQERHYGAVQRDDWQ